MDTWMNGFVYGWIEFQLTFRISKGQIGSHSNEISEIKILEQVRSQIARHTEKFS